MPLFRQPVPDPPGPKAKPSPIREGDTIKALAESRSVLQRLVNLLAPYRPKTITDANGFRVDVLAIDYGKEPIGPAADVPPHPFKVTKRNNGTPENPIWQANVELNSSLMKSLRPNDNQVIIGLDAWFTLLPTDTIWLGIVFTPGTSIITFCGIDSLGLGDSFNTTEAAWASGLSYVSDDGGTPKKHQASRSLIAFATPGTGGEPILTQSCFTHLVLRNLCIDGRAAIFPFPSPYGPSV